MGGIFISYKRTDKKKVHRIKNKIEQTTGVNCWIDLEGIESDKVFASVIMKAINEAEIVLFMYSSAHRKIKDFSNDWTMRELNFARKKNKRIVFINLDGSPLADIFELQFGLTQQMDARSEESMKSLIRDIEKWLNIDERRKSDLSDKNIKQSIEISLFEKIINQILEYYKCLRNKILTFERNLSNSLSHSCKKVVFSIKNYYSKKKRQIVWGITSLCFISLFIIFQKPVVRVIKPLWESLAVTSDTTKTDTINVDPIFDKLISDMVFVKGGTFVKGATDEQKSDACKDEYPATRVSVHDFYLCKYEVTQSLWYHVMKEKYPEKASPSNFKGDRLPVEKVTWSDCQLFFKELNRQTGGNFRLPTEAEWEYASRGGVYSKGYVFSGGDDLKNLGWYHENSEQRTHPVGSKRPNELGIFDMSGNVSEWCSDKYIMYNETSASGSGDYCFRGGNWFNTYYLCRSAKRLGNKRDFLSAGVGLRIAADSITLGNRKN